MASTRNRKRARDDDNDEEDNLALLSTSPSLTASYSGVADRTHSVATAKRQRLDPELSPTTTATSSLLPTPLHTPDLSEENISLKQQPPVTYAGGPRSSGVKVNASRTAHRGTDAYSGLSSPPLSPMPIATPTMAVPSTSGGECPTID